MENKWIVIGALAVAATASAQESVTISREMTTANAYQAVLTRLKQDGLDVKSASEDAGIETGLTESGGIVKTGCYYKFTFIPADGNKTTVRIVAFTKKRLKGAVQWTGPKEDIDRSRAEAFQLQHELGW